MSHRTRLSVSSKGGRNQRRTCFAVTRGVLYAGTTSVFREVNVIRYARSYTRFVRSPDNNVLLSGDWPLLTHLSGANLITTQSTNVDATYFQSLGRFVCHLDAVLQDGHRKFFARHGRQPQAEVLVHRIGAQILAQTLQLGEPRHVQMTILQIYLQRLHRTN